MRRTIITPRPDWLAIVESQGLAWAGGPSAAQPPYWNEGAYYSFSGADVAAIERATADLWDRSLEAVQHVIDEDRFDELAIPRAVVPAIVKSWNDEPPSLYGRFDFSLDGGTPKLLEFNADTPTSLVEAAVVQWSWKEQRFPSVDQFNSLHDKLVAKWADVAPFLNSRLVHFASADDSVREDTTTTAYLAYTAQLAGLTTDRLLMPEVGWNAIAREFRDQSERPIKTIFKLYPWEWLIHEEFGTHILSNPDTMWLEPIWKMVLSNKGILAILWELFPEHPNLLEAHFGEPSDAMWGWAKKPLLSREGAGVTLRTQDQFIHQSPALGYGEEGFVFQALAPLPVFDGKHAVVGSWVVDGAPAGVGVRESEDPITGNTSQFVPHLIEG